MHGRGLLVRDEIYGTREYVVIPPRQGIAGSSSAREEKQINVERLVNVEQISVERLVSVERLPGRSIAECPSSAHAGEQRLAVSECGARARARSTSPFLRRRASGSQTSGSLPPTNRGWREVDREWVGETG